MVAELETKSKVVPIADGAQMMMAFAKLASRGTTPSLVILDHQLGRIRGRACAEFIRAVERGFDVPKTPILFYTEDPSDEAFKRFTNGLGHTLQLTRKTDKDISGQAKRLTKAINRILEKVAQ